MEETVLERKYNELQFGIEKENKCEYLKLWSKGLVLERETPNINNTPSSEHLIKWAKLNVMPLQCINIFQLQMF